MEIPTDDLKKIEQLKDSLGRLHKVAIDAVNNRWKRTGSENQPVVNDAHRSVLAIVDATFATLLAATDILAEGTFAGNQEDS